MFLLTCGAAGLIFSIISELRGERNRNLAKSYEEEQAMLRASLGMSTPSPEHSVEAAQPTKLRKPIPLKKLKVHFQIDGHLVGGWSPTGYGRPQDVMWYFRQHAFWYHMEHGHPPDTSIYKILSISEKKP